MKKYCIIILFIMYWSGLPAQTFIPPTEVTIKNNEGALFAVSKKVDFSKAKIVIPYNTKLKVLKIYKQIQQVAEGNAITYYYYQVEYKGKIGWVKDVDTDYIDY